MSEIFLTETEASARFGVARRTLQRWRVTGDGPPFTRIGPRRVVYPAAQTAAWLDARTFPHRAAEATGRPIGGSR